MTVALIALLSGIYLGSAITQATQLHQARRKGFAMIGIRSFVAVEKTGGI